MSTAFWTILLTYTHKPPIISTATLLRYSQDCAFVSNAWGGHTSNKYTTEITSWRHHPADQRFHIAESVETMRANLRMPTFMKGKSQLYVLEVEELLPMLGFILKSFNL